MLTTRQYATLLTAQVAATIVALAPLVWLARP